MQIFRIRFINQGKLYELYAESVRQGDFYGFVEIEGLVFEQTSSVVIDPAEERLRNEFKGVNRTLVPMHAIIRIDQVEKKGQGKIVDIENNSSNVTPFPGAIYAPEKTPDKDS